eukprot:GILK01011623.1.p1 GENE.GILK01011623.1~~GILK01011623.1.p1  ORF type:complete len:483 (-),score=71.96 GILK01011623.1:136-1479(-)
MDTTKPGFLDRRAVGLGQYLRQVDDQTVLAVVEFLSPKELCVLSVVSKALYLFTQEDELWKYFVLDRFGGEFAFQHNWKSTYVHQCYPHFPFSHQPIQVSFFYSDYLFQSWRCSSLDVKCWADAPDTIDRRSNLTMEEFTREYLVPNKPVILTDVVTQWPAFKEWNEQTLIDKAGDTKFFINSNVYMTMADYMRYCNHVQEENPMYLFDHYYGEKAPQLLHDYAVPDYFSEDLFAVLGAKRPSFRWLLVGPTRAGASFHKDPNHTSAWNAVITGVKKWVMYPPHVTPPGVHPSEDGLEVVTPISIVEWFTNFYQPNKRPRTAGNMSCNGNGAKKEFLECLLRPGEIIFVPTGWWHTVLNLEPSIAITQNFCDSHNIHNVLDFMRKKKKLDLVEQFESRLKELRPKVWQQIQNNDNDNDNRNDNGQNAPKKSSRPLVDKSQSNFMFDF